MCSNTHFWVLLLYKEHNEARKEKADSKGACGANDKPRKIRLTGFDLEKTKGSKEAAASNKRFVVQLSTHLEMKWLPYTLNKPEW